ncbi:MAG TPA: NDP-sugar synthase [Thermoanaerobaculia bacterium]|jgi:NDP-sugar pyrophosphorylase family protein|nr:NDP-sugar synthase [Thermoanaerobaculia bacterium]
MPGIVSAEEPVLRGVILAAGLGLRLRPLTNEIPKPLLPVAGRPIIVRTLDALARAGCEAVAINLHHLGDRIRAAIGTRHAGMPIEYFEEPEILGTLGALPPMRSFLRPAGLVVLANGDSLCRWPIEPLIARHRATGARATLLLAKRSDPEELGGGVGVDRSGRIVQMRDGPAARIVARRRAFAGMHVFAPDLLAEVTAGPADIVERLYLPLLARGERIESFSTAALWHDLGTPRRYLDGALAWVAGQPGGSWISPSAEISPRASIARSIVEAGCRVEAGARIERSVLLSGAVIGAGSTLRSALLGPGAVAAPGGTVEGELLVREVSPGGLR